MSHLYTYVLKSFFFLWLKIFFHLLHVWETYEIYKFISFVMKISWKFIVLDDPVDRIFSTYIFKSCYIRKSYKFSRKKNFRYFNPPLPVEAIFPTTRWLVTRVQFCKDRFIISTNCKYCLNNTCKYKFIVTILLPGSSST